MLATSVTGGILASDALEGHHEGDTYNPVDPASLPNRLRTAGFTRIDIRANDFGWAAIAHTPVS